ncbi:MAG: DUF3820 family protein [Alicyclobacillaceae bacterium]|nr:DUF3820 family protein [Alicyclobacillaceae bacterium]
MTLLRDTRFVVLDTETTGLDPETDQVIDLSLVEVSKRGIVPLYETRIDPKRPIPPESSAVHHLTDRDVAGKPTLDAVWPTVLDHLQDAVLVAHNASFDRAMLPETHRPWVCSKRMAQHLWPDAPNHKNQTLRYYLGIDVDAEPAHSAAGDTWVTAHVFWRELGEYRSRVAQTDGLEEFLAWANSPIEVKKMPFGKHRGKLIKQLPTDYIRWALANVEEMDADLRHSMERVLKDGVGA